MGAVKHDGRKSSIDAFVAALVGAVIQMQRNRNRDVQLFDHRFYHRRYCLKASHILAGALRYT